MVAMAVLGALALMVISWSTLLVNEAAQAAEQRMRRDVDEALSTLQTWYERQADAIAAAGTTPSESELLAVLVNRPPGLRVAMSSSMATVGCSSGTIECIPWRKIAVWYPSTATPPATTLSNGLPVSEFTGNAIWRIYSSQSWFIARYALTQSRLNEVSNTLMSWFTTQKLTDPFEGVSTNYWRASDCSNPGRQLPCVDTFTDLSSSGGALVRTSLGLSTQDVSTALQGGSSPSTGGVEFSNLQGSSSSADSTSVGLRAPLPWGGYIAMTVLKP